MFEFITDLFDDLDTTALAIGIGMSALLWAMMWGLPWWRTIGFTNKMIISALAPFIFYIVAKIRLDKG